MASYLQFFSWWIFLGNRDSINYLYMVQDDGNRYGFLIHFCMGLKNESRKIPVLCEAESSIAEECVILLRIFCGFL